MAYFTYDARKAPGHDPREPLFPSYKDAANPGLVAVAVALKFGWYVAVPSLLAWLTWLAPVSPAPLFLLVWLIVTFGGVGND